MTARTDFWSARRARVEAEAQAEVAVAEARTEAEQLAALEEKTDEEILETLELPDPDTLQMGDDVTAFMSRMVPDRIRRRALRRLWRTNPTLANVDGLVDYGGDFTDAATVVENLQTAYQVGKGMLDHVLKMEAEAQAEAVDDADLMPEGHESKPEVEDNVGEMVDESPGDCEREVINEFADDASVTSADDAEGPSPRRRMHFAFDEDATA